MPPVPTPSIKLDDLFVGSARPTQEVRLSKRLSAVLRVITLDEMLHVQEACTTAQATARGFLMRYLAASLVEGGGHKFDDAYESGAWNDAAFTANLARVLAMSESVANRLVAQLNQYALRVRWMLWNAPEGKDQPPATEEEHLAEVEGRCSALSEDELYATGRVKQHVPILPGRFEIVLQSLSNDESLYVESATQGVYGLGQGVARRLACALVSMSGVMYDSHVVDGRFESKIVDRKTLDMLRLPMPVVAELDMQEAAFTRRVNAAFQWESLGNG